ncbi:hypothetical protein BC826DRAFT_1065011 [Russula brevipes]|nr:hypothetical protein BC826DRAFT_1065011 [Russula brevipes]
MSTPRPPRLTPGPTFGTPLMTSSSYSALPSTQIAKAHPIAPRPACPRNYAAMPFSQGPWLQLRAHPWAARCHSMSASLRRGELQRAEHLTSGRTQTQGATHAPSAGTPCISGRFSLPKSTPGTQTWHKMRPHKVLNLSIWPPPPSPSWKLYAT